MWLSEDDVQNAWGHVKSFVGNAWHHGQKVMGSIDRIANLGIRILGAAAQAGLVKGRALETGIRAANEYDAIRSKAMDFGKNTQRTLQRFRAAAPELNL